MASGVPASLIQAVEREGIRLGRRVDGEDRYTAADIELVRTALRLLEFGLPLPDLLALARDADTAMRGLAERAVDLFDEHVRKPIRDTAGDDERAAEQMVEAFSELLPAVTTLVSHHFRRVLLETAEDHIEDPAEARVSAPAAAGRREAPRGPRAVRHDLAALRPGEPGDDVRHGRRMATHARCASLRLPGAPSWPTSRAAPATSAASSNGGATARSGSTSPTACW